MTTIEDDRTDEQRATLTWGVRMYDKFMSGWGGAHGGASVAIWACRYEDLDRVYDWVKARSEARRVAFVRLPGSPRGIRPYRPARGVAHVHVYVALPGHPALPMASEVRA